VALGAGRARKGEAIDSAVGFILRAKIGNRVEAGDPLAEVHANDERRLEQALLAVRDAYSFSEQAVRPPELVKAIIPAP
jgi:pyrimidine-nucleoside phosphorylase